ncbi:MAG: glycoside hydrolase family 2, partial [Propionibacteriaceae bacterium]|nr:glycoside hydrolase family 2 [Propionibacteriaceae bacterium]
MRKTATMPSSHPRPEYPRPHRDRSQRWASLNGEWGFEPEWGPARAISVPFAWETPASGVGQAWLERAAYTRRIDLPVWGAARTFLCFGAVHHTARVLLDGQLLGIHVGGHTPFEYDITDLTMPGGSAMLRVEVTAPIDKAHIPHGKQRSIPRNDFDGVCFTPTSGIWQPVWLEARGRTYLAELRIRGDSLDSFHVEGRLAGDHPQRMAVTIAGAGVDAELTCDQDGHFGGELPVAAPRLWSPADPHLYGLAVQVTDGDSEDALTATAGLRRVEIVGEQLFLNRERIYLRGVLDQGYWPQTGLTAPTDQALRDDLLLARRLGYNLVRKHIKLEDPRWLDHADRLGILVWSEPPGPSRHSASAAEAFLAQLPDWIARDANHPSIIIWGLYNEEWGLDWDIAGRPELAAAARAAYERLAGLDHSRPIVENSGWEHVRTDLLDWHLYQDDPARWAAQIAALAAGEAETFPVTLGPDFTVEKGLYADDGIPRRGLPILNSEYGGGFGSLERAWHLRWQTQELRRHDRFAGYVYTELTDVEHEVAGLVDAWRQPKDFAQLDPAEVNAQTVLVLDVLPAAPGADVPEPTGPLTLAVQVSHHGLDALCGTLCAAWSPTGSALPPDAVAQVAA